LPICCCFDSPSETSEYPGWAGGCAGIALLEPVRGGGGVMPGVAAEQDTDEDWRQYKWITRRANRSKFYVESPSGYIGAFDTVQEALVALEVRMGCAREHLRRRAHNHPTAAELEESRNWLYVSYNKQRHNFRVQSHDHHIGTRRTLAEAVELAGMAFGLSRTQLWLGEGPPPQPSAGRPEPVRRRRTRRFASGSAQLAPALHEPALGPALGPSTEAQQVQLLVGAQPRALQLEEPAMGTGVDAQRLLGPAPLGPEPTERVPGLDVEVVCPAVAPPAVSQQCFVLPCCSHALQDSVSISCFH
jgi:hypothetical protein